MEERLPEAEAAVTQIRVDIPVDTEAIRGGSMAGSSKTGDVRPFKMMAVLGLIGMGLLTGGVVIYRRTVSGKKKYKGYAAEMKKTQNICSKYDHSSNRASYICAGFYIKVMNRILQQGRNMQSFPKWQG